LLVLFVTGESMSQELRKLQRIHQLKDATVGLSKSIADDMEALSPHIKVGFDELQNGKWLEDKKLLLVMGFGLAPLLILTVFSGDLKSAYWAFALYFSIIWAAFFYFIFPNENIKVGQAVGAFAATAFISMSILLYSYRILPFSWLSDLTDSRHSIVRCLGFIFGVGLPEELCKSAAIFYILNRAKKTGISVSDIIFYGLMSGLGFGIYEGVSYQMGRNFSYSSSSSEYYLLNIIRLTSLPFLHAIWTGIAAYFLSFSFLFPRRRKGLILLAIGIPTILHAFYDIFALDTLGILLAVLSVAIFGIFLKKAKDLESGLQADAQL
jgi:protease PrsW